VALWALTGGSGFLGVNLARRLAAAGHAVRNLDSEPGDEPAVEAVCGDVRDPAAARVLCRGADVLVHAAAALPVRGRQIRDVTVNGTATVLAAAREAGVRRAIFLSSAVVYGLGGSRPATEEMPPAPFEAYGAAKLAAERLCAELGARGLETVVLRPQAFVGTGRLGIFGILFAWVREGRRVYTLGRGHNRYQLLDVRDLVEAVLLAAERPVAGETFNLGAAEYGTVAEELGALVAHAGTGSCVTPLPARPARALLRALDLAGLSPLSEWHYRTADRDCAVDVSKAEELLGWRASRSGGRALIEAYDWYVAEGAALRRPGTTHRAPWNERALGLVRRLS
jgi:nucleoside-diphosphate-sugar epimerase